MRREEGNNVRLCIDLCKFVNKFNIITYAHAILNLLQFIDIIYGYNNVTTTIIIVYFVKYVLRYNVVCCWFIRIK